MNVGFFTEFLEEVYSIFPRTLPPCSSWKGSDEVKMAPRRRFPSEEEDVNTRYRKLQG